MAEKGFKTIPGTVNIPSSNDVNNGGFKDLLQVQWTDSVWRYKSSLSITHGDTTRWVSDTNYSITRQANLYTPSSSQGLEIYAESGDEHKVIYEIHGNSRWMPASVFNGLGFETKFEHVADGKNHELYLRKYAVIFANKNTSSYRIWAWDTGNTDRPDGDYRYDKIHSSYADVATIRNWGPDWLFQGLAIYLYTNKGVGTTDSKLTLFNLKIGHKFSTVGGQYRYLPAGKRAYSKRDASINNVPFQDPFA